MEWAPRLTVRGLSSLAVALVILSVIAPAVGSQVVRGVVTERSSGVPLAGVLVSVAAVPDSSVRGGIRHTLSDARGEFAVTLPGPGNWILSAKRIGVARYSTPFSVAVGETRRFTIELEPFGASLPQVVVQGTPLCLRRPEQIRTIVALWDEARTALRASEVTREANALTGWLSRYTRTLEPQSLRILDEHRSIAEGRFNHPIRSVSGDSLAKVGYWRRIDDDGTMEFHGPDAEALLSESFQLGHCFEFVTGRGDRRGLLGIFFTPRTVKLTGGIEGTIWIDMGTFELRFVEFRYTNLITIPSNPHIGGAVHFSRHTSGAWIVHRWYVRMPQFPTVRAAVSGLGGSETRRAYVHRIIEEGGTLFTPGAVTSERLGSISGTVMDSTGRRALTGTLVSLSGTPYSVEVDSSGGFRFDSIPPGAYALVASHPFYAGLGQLVDDEPMTLSPGQAWRTTMRAVSTSQLLSILCQGKKLKPTDATVRVVLTHADNGTPLARTPVLLRWPDPDRKPSADSTTGLRRITSGIQTLTDAIGGAIFCGVPAGASLELVIVRPDDDPEVVGGTRVERVSEFKLGPGEISSRHFTARPPRPPEGVMTPRR